MKIDLKKILKFAVGTCAVLGVAAAVTSDTVVKVVSAGLKAGTEAMKEQWDELHTGPVAKTVTGTSLSAEEAEMFADVGSEAENFSELSF